MDMLHDKSTFQNSLPYSFRNIPARVGAKFCMSKHTFLGVNCRDDTK